MAIRTFDYLTKENATTFFHSLPYSRTKLFAVNALIGYALIVIPMLVVSGMTLVVSLIRGTGIALYIFELFGVLLCECFYVYAFTILMVMLFGNKGSLFPMTAILFCYTEIMFFISDIILCHILDINTAVNTPSGSLIYLSPLRVCTTVELSYGFNPAINQFNNTFSFVHVEKILPAEIICGTLMLILAYVMYRKRKSERSGEVVVFNSCRYIFKWGFSISLAAFMTLIFGVTTVYGMKNTTLKNVIICGSFIAFSLILYLIAEMIVSKKFNIFKKVRFELLPVFTVTLVLSFLAAADIFGLRDYVPEFDDTKYLTVNIERDRDDKLQLIELSTIHINSEPGDIGIKKAFYDLHKRILNEKPKTDKYDTTIQFIYYDKDDHIYDRRYTIPKEYLDPLSFYIEQRKEEKASFMREGDRFELLNPSYVLRRFLSFVRT
ncbi:MAG: hypothetical protein K5655_08315 [Lachnospiraceae bacterium]|nr:hypothetical protein [Lachnospiraceae bacterium]